MVEILTAIVGATLATAFHALSGIMAAKTEEKDKFKFDWNKLLMSYGLTLSVALFASSGFLPQDMQGGLDSLLGDDILAYTGSTVVLTKFINTAQNILIKDADKK